MPIVVERSFTIERGTLREFERLSREHIWPYMEARGCRILGLFSNVHGGPSDEITLLTAYESLAHWEETRLEGPVPEGSPPELETLRVAAFEANQARTKLTRVSQTRVLGLVTRGVDLGVHRG